MFTTIQSKCLLIPPIQDVETCNLTRPLLLRVDDSLTVLLPLLSLAVSGRFISMAYTHHLNDAAYYLFLGTNGGRMFQVKLSMIVLFYARLLLCALYDHTNTFSSLAR